MHSSAVVSEALSVLGTQGITSNWNNQISTNSGAPIGPATTVTFTPAPFVSRNGRVLVMAFATVETDVAGKRAVFKLIRDGGAIGGFLSAGSVATDVDTVASGCVMWVDVVTPGSSHTWGIQMTSLVSLTIPAGQATVVLVDL